MKEDALKKLGVTAEQYGSLMFGMYNVIFCNDLCTGYAYDLIEEIRRRGYYRNGIKRRSNILMLEIKRYNDRLAKIAKFSHYIADANDIFSEAIAHDRQVLKITTRNYMEKCRMPEATLQAKAAILFIFSRGACHNVDINLEKRRDIRRLTYGMQALRLTKVNEAVKRLLDEIDKVLGGNCDLNDNDDIYNGFVIICRKLADAELLQKVVDEADQMYKELWK